MCDELDYNIISLKVTKCFDSIIFQHPHHVLTYNLWFTQTFWSFEPDLHAVVCIRASDALLILYNFTVIYHAKIQHRPGSEEYW